MGNVSILVTNSSKLCLFLGIREREYDYGFYSPKQGVLSPLSFYTGYVSTSRFYRVRGRKKSGGSFFVVILIVSRFWFLGFDLAFRLS